MDLTKNKLLENTVWKPFPSSAYYLVETFCDVSDVWSTLQSVRNASFISGFFLNVAANKVYSCSAELQRQHLFIIINK